MMFSAVSGKLVVALPVLCAEMALGGQYMGAGTCGASANYGSTFVRPRDGMLAQFSPEGGGQVVEILPLVEILDSMSCEQFQLDNRRSRPLPLHI